MTQSSPATIKITDPKFRVVIPQHIRELLGIEIGDFIEITVKKVIPITEGVTAK